MNRLEATNVRGIAQYDSPFLHIDSLIMQTMEGTLKGDFGMIQDPGGKIFTNANSSLYNLDIQQLFYAVIICPFIYFPTDILKIHIRIVSIIVHTDNARLNDRGDLVALRHLEAYHGRYDSGYQGAGYDEPLPFPQNPEIVDKVYFVFVWRVVLWIWGLLWFIVGHCLSPKCYLGITCYVLSVRC